MFSPDYQGESLNRTVNWILNQIGFYHIVDNFYWQIIVEYTSVVVMGILIALNVQSFMRNLLMSLKNLLREASLFKTDYNTNILIFAFVSPFSLSSIFDEPLFFP